ncbi:cyclic lactone autoinducer peptide [Clostridium lundense]|nr:cyclic lactone autoinducer peptide [Clostridium lundense]
MNTSSKFSKFLATKLSNLSTDVAKTSTKSCVPLFIGQPKMPESLLKKDK